MAANPHQGTFCAPSHSSSLGTHTHGEKIATVTDSTNYLDAEGAADATYQVAAVVDGVELQRSDLGVNIRSGAHYTQFMVYGLAALSRSIQAA